MTQFILNTTAADKTKKLAGSQPSSRKFLDIALLQSKSFLTDPSGAATWNSFSLAFPAKKTTIPASSQIHQLQHKLLRRLLPTIDQYRLRLIHHH